MTTRWTLTIDCAHPTELAKFWAVALGYREPPVPNGFDSWPDWLIHHHVPEEEWDDGAYLADPDGIGPTLSLLKVPESKVVKNRLHIDIQAGGGRDANPWEVRWPRVLAAAERLVAPAGQ
jgi:hypothetical protein